MLYTVTTKRRPLNVRSGPALNYRVVSTLARGTTVDVIEVRETLHEGLWLRINRGWVSWLYLTPVSGERRPQPGSQPLPDFLSSNPHLSALERQLATLRDRLEHAEGLFYVNSQMAADEGSRLYEKDPLRELSEGSIRTLETVAQIAAIAGGGGAPDPGMAGIERNQRWARMKEFERNAARYQREVTSILREITRLRREIEQER